MYSIVKLRRLYRSVVRNNILSQSKRFAGSWRVSGRIVTFRQAADRERAKYGAARSITHLDYFK